MDNQQLLKKFRMGFKQFKDKSTGKTYVASGLLDKKVGRLNIYGLALVVINPAILFGNYIPSLELQLLAVFGYFVLMIFIFRWFAKLFILESDLKDVIIKEPK